MFSVAKIISFCYGHRLLNYAGKCRHLHGHNGLLEIRLERKNLNRLGMVMDFEEIKATVQKWVDQELDHKLILHREDPLVPTLRKFAQPLVLLPGNPTAEAIARYIFHYCRKRKLPVCQVRLWETPSSYADIYV